MGSLEKEISLRLVDRSNIDRVLGLKVKPEQTDFVAATPYTIAQASTYDEAWLRAIYFDDIPIGLIAMKIHPNESSYYLWRMMIDERHQQNGYGRRAISALKDEVRKLGGSQISIRIKPGKDGPEGFYRKLEFHLKRSCDGSDEYILHF